MGDCVGVVTGGGDTKTYYYWCIDCIHEQMMSALQQKENEHQQHQQLPPGDTAWVCRGCGDVHHGYSHFEDGVLHQPGSLLEEEEQHADEKEQEPQKEPEPKPEPRPGSAPLLETPLPEIDWNKILTAQPTNTEFKWTFNPLPTTVVTLNDQEPEEDKTDEAIFTLAERDPDPDRKPLFELPLVPVRTGEEDESVIFRAPCKLYRVKDKRWKQRGQGFLKILQHHTTKKCRLVMRQLITGKVILNHLLERYVKPNQGLPLWCGNDVSDGEAQLVYFKAQFAEDFFTNGFLDCYTNTIARPETQWIPRPLPSSADDDHNMQKVMALEDLDECELVESVHALHVTDQSK